MAEEINDEFYSVPESEEENTLDSDEVLQAAKKAFGISYFFPWQRIVIANILDSANPGNDILKDDVCSNGRQIVLLPTGAGKSLCFLAPALLLDKPTLVIYPLLALISDQKRRMDEGGLGCVVFRGGQTDLEREENFMRIKNGAKVIITNPEALQNKNLLERLCSFGIVHIAIDEAHCVSEWGDSFRPAYLNLGKVIKKINPPVVTAFTATASENVLSRVSEVLFDGEAKIVRSESDRPNIHYQVIKCYAKKRTAFLLALTEQKPLIIFCGTRAKSEDMARELSAYCGNDKVKFYHAGMSREEKQKVEKWFYPKDDAILCCTCAFGMGVDKKNIRTVIHLEPSPSAESYIQEAGRGGRDGEISNAIFLWSFYDHKKFSAIKENDRRKVMQKFAESKTCRRQILLDALGGEQAACDGCDVCSGKSDKKIAPDAKIVMELVRKNPNRFTQDELNQEAMIALNKTAGKNCSVNIYEHSDMDEIISQLKMQKIIRIRKFPFKGLIAPARQNLKLCFRQLLRTKRNDFQSSIF